MALRTQGPLRMEATACLAAEAGKIRDRGDRWRSKRMEALACRRLGHMLARPPVLLPMPPTTPLLLLVLPSPLPWTPAVLVPMLPLLLG